MHSLCLAQDQPSIFVIVSGISGCSAVVVCSLVKPSQLPLVMKCSVGVSKNRKNIVADLMTWTPFLETLPGASISFFA